MKYIDILRIHFVKKSPSTRRVWIEITLLVALLWKLVVTLHAEGVD